MISGKLQFVVLVAVLVYFLVLFYMLNKKRLSLRYTLLWIFSGALMLLFAVFPGILSWFSSMIGIMTPTNALFAVMIFCIIMLLISLTAIVSKQTEQIKRLTQSVALLEKRCRELEEANPAHTDGQEVRETVAL